MRSGVGVAPAHRGQGNRDRSDAEPVITGDVGGCDPQTNKSASCQSRAREGSAALNVTATTPPMSLWNSSDELVPITQWQDMKRALAAAGIPFKTTELTGHLHSNAYTYQAFCPTVTFLTSYLGPYTFTCIAPPSPGRSGTG